MPMWKEGGRSRLLRYVDLLAPWLAVMLFCVLMAFLAPGRFFWWRNIIGVLVSASSYIIVAVGMTFVMTGGGIDLSVASTMGLASAFAAVAVKHTAIDPTLALFLGLAGGGVLGLVNGLLITRLKLPDFIATLATMLAFRGIISVWLPGRILFRFPPAITYLGQARWWGVIPVAVVVALFVVAVTDLLLYKRTKFGRYTIALGGNRRAAVHAGIPVERYKIYTYVFSGFMAALAGLLHMGSIDTFSAFHADGYLLPTIAAVVIGGTALYGGVGRVWGSLAGALFIAMVINGLVIAGLPYFWQQVVLGTLIIAGVAVYTLTGLRESPGVGGRG